MGRLFVLNLEGNVYSCKHCRTHLALYQDIVSKTFHCRHGKAYLFTKVSVSVFLCSMATSSQPPTSQTGATEPTVTSDADRVRAGMVKPTGPNLDMAWQWNSLKDINNKKAVTCDFCLKTTNGGISRAKRHQMGIRGDVGACTRVPPEIKQKIKDAVEAKKSAVDASVKEMLLENEEEDADVQEIANIRAGKRAATGVKVGGRGNFKGPLDVHFFKNPEVSQKTTMALARRQSSIKDSCVKEARALTIQYIARHFYRNGIPFNVGRDKTFRLMLEAVGNYGPHLKPPTYHELRVTCLKKELQLTKDSLKVLEAERVEYGCSIMSDAWTDTKSRTLINFLVNSPSGTMFVRSIDGSSYAKTGLKLFELLDGFVEEIGAQNVVQVVTDNGSNYVLAGKFLQEQHPRIFWTPCAAHCLDLMLEDVGKLVRVKRAIGRGQYLVGFIYNHPLALNMMRNFTNNTELVRSGVTRFATTFLTLQRLHKLKNNLRRMFTSEDWLNTKTSKEVKGKKARDIVLMTVFWSDVLYSLKAMGALVQVLRMVDNEKKPAMGYIYEAMDRAKESIAKAFNENTEKYKDIFEIIDKRWECQLHHPLHAAGHYFNPEFFYKDARIAKDKEVTTGLFECIQKLSIDNEANDQALTELPIYRRAQESFGIPSAIRQRSTLSPAEWWITYGNHVPTLQSIAVKVLSLTCSSSGCERNWSSFEQIHSKKRSKLEHQKLQDLVFVRYNQTLRERYNSKDLIDPISLGNIDDCNEWLLGGVNEDGEGAEGDTVFGDDNLTWAAVEEATGVSEPTRVTRQHTRATIVPNEEEEVEEEEHDESDGEAELDDAYVVEDLSEDSE